MTRHLPNPARPARLLLWALLVPWAFAAPTRSLQADQHLLLEKLRYLHDITGETHQVKGELSKIIQSTFDKDVLSKSNYFLGTIYDRQNLLDSASHFYREALKDSKLGKTETEWIYRRLGKINPELIQAVTLQKGKISKILKTYGTYDEDGADYVLQVHNTDEPPGFSGNFVRVDVEGNIEDFEIALGPGEKLLDIKGKEALLASNGSVKVLIEGRHAAFQIQDIDNFIHAELVKGTEGAFMAQYPNHLAYYESGQLLHTLEFKGSECAWEAGSEPGTGSLLCKDGPVYNIQLDEGIIERVSALKNKPYFVKVRSRRAVIQFFNHFEIRTGKNLNKLLWRSASKLSDKIFITQSYIYVLDAKGSLRSFNIESGQQLWERELEIKEAYPTDREIYVINHAQACLGIGLNGEVNWTYEFGWDSQITPLLGKNYLILFYQDGRRIHLNLDLVQISKSSNAEKIANLMASMENTDWASQLKYVNGLLKIEPGNGMAWEYKYMCLKQLGRPRNEQLQSLVQSARSLHSPVWKQSPVLQTLNSILGSRWIWKRAYGQKYYPALIPKKDLIAYLENNNQTLILLRAPSGILKETIHIPEELDSKLMEWFHDRIIASSPTKIYSVPTSESGAGTQTMALNKPICKAVLMGDLLFISDWFGNLVKVNLMEGLETSPAWRKNYSNNGLLIAPSSASKFLDAIDIQGRYFSISKIDGEIQYSGELPRGTITDISMHGEILFAGYDDGRLVAFDKGKRKVAWTRTFSHQIFSLDASDSDLLFVTTSTKRLYCLDSRNGGFKSEATIPTSLINKPVVVKDGYWLSTTAPALEKRDFEHNLLVRYQLTDLPGNPVITDGSIYVSTLDGFIYAFSQ